MGRWLVVDGCSWWLGNLFNHVAQREVQRQPLDVAPNVARLATDWAPAKCMLGEFLPRTD